MKTTHKIWTVLFVLLLITAGTAGSVSAAYSYTMEPWEEEFLAEYGEPWMYDQYGIYWFTYYQDENAEGYDLEYYDELLTKYLELKAQNDAAALTPVETPVPTETIPPTETPVETPTQVETPPPIEVVTPTPTVPETPNLPITPTDTAGDDGTGVPYIPIIIICAVAAGILFAVLFVVIRRGKSDTQDILAPVSMQDEPEISTVDAESAADEPEDEPAGEPDADSVSEEPEAILEPVLPVTLTPRESYTKVAEHLADKYGILHVSSLTPRQLLECADSTAELQEFILLYEQIRYAPDVHPEQMKKLAELAAVILKQ